MRILVIQQKMIGDVLTSSIICERLRIQYPDAIIDYVINSNTIPVIKENPYVDHIIEFTPTYKKSKIAFIKFLLQLRKTPYDLVIDAYGKLESNLMCLFAKSKKKISFYKWYTHFIYSKTIQRASTPLTNASIAIENRLRLVVKEEALPDAIRPPKIFLSEDEKNNAKTYLSECAINFNKPLIMISVLGSSPQKTLPFEHMAKVIDTIVKTTDATILFNYIPSQEQDARTIYEHTTPRTQENIEFTIFGKSLREFIAILYHCDALIGNEGGAVNMAKALHKPTFTIFSPWIIKKDWNMFEDGKLHDSIHLMDAKPELYGHNSPKKMKNKALELYQAFTADLITPKLETYLKQITL